MANNTPLKTKFKSYRGITFKADVYAEADVTDEPLDLAGYEARMQVRDGYGGTLIADLSIGSGLSFPGLGIVRIEISASETEAMAVGSYRYDLEIESPGGVVDQLIYGAFQVKDSITT